MGSLNEEVVLVTPADEVVGTADKMRAHREGLLHRAFSVFLFDDQGRLLLQKRAEGKYHSAGLWTNSCCSHPRPGEVVIEAARRRIKEELGILAEVRHRFSFVYHATLPNGLIEHEYDHVFFGQWSGNVNPDPDEVAAWEYASIEEVDLALRDRPDSFTVWLRTCWPQVLGELRSHPLVR